MKVTVHVYGPYQEIIEAKSLEMTLPEDALIEKALSELFSDYPDIGSTGSTSLAEFVKTANVTLNGKNIRHLNGIDTQLTDGDVIRLASAVAGG